MIDLSFLTEEEQEKIRAVLNRDAELKKCEERRVQNLQRTVSDRERLRFLTGEWFYETKQRRHQDRIHGSEIIRASMRHSHRPITILELSQILPEKPSFVDSENREVFVPPVLCGVLQEPRSLPGNSRCQQFDETAEEDSPRPALTSPTKRRRNPFNVVETPCGDDTDVELSAGRPEPSEEPFPSSDSCMCLINDLKRDPNDGHVAQNAWILASLPENGAAHDEDGPGGQHATSGAPRGILKRSSSSESLLSGLDLKVDLDPHSHTWTDRKQVRFRESSGLDVNDITSCQPQPDRGLEDPGSDLEDPYSGLEDPRSDLEDPGSGLEDPGSGLEGPRSGLEDPYSGLEDPYSDLEDPGSGLEGPGPGSGLEDPRSGLEDPYSGLEDPRSGLEGPGSGLEDPGSDLEDPGSDLEGSGPRSGLEDLRSGLEGPGSGLEDPGSGLKDPRSGLEDPGSGLEDPRSGLEGPGSGLEGPGPGSGLEDHGSGLEGPGSGLEDPGSGLEDPGSGLEDPGSGLEDPGSGLEGPGSDLEDPGPGSGLEDPGSGLEDPRSGLEGPGSDLEGPRSGLEGPGSDLEGPRSDLEDPRSDLEGPGSDLEGPRSDLEGPGSDLEGPGSDLEGPGSDLEGPRSDLEDPGSGPGLDSSESGLKNEANLLEQEAGLHTLGGVAEDCGSPVWAQQDSGKSGAEPANATDQPAGRTTSSHAVSPKPRQKLLGIFRREKEKKPEEEEKPKRDEAGNAQNVSTASVKQDAKPRDVSGVRNLPLTALQKTPFRETNLEAFWERENRITFTSKDREGKHADNNPGESGFLVDPSRDDVTYRANPVVIYEETDDSSAESQENVITSTNDRKKEKNEKEDPGVKSSILRKREIPPQSDPTTSSPSKTQSKTANQKGFISPETYHVKADSERKPQRCREQDEEVKRSPSKTCHPRVLPRESSSPQRSTPRGSPLKTFPILLHVQTRPTPLPRHKKSPSPTPDSTDSPQTSCGDVKTQPRSPNSSTSPPKSPKTPTLARSVVPRDYSHYLGPHDKSYVPPFHPQDGVETSQNHVRDSAGNRSEGLSGRSPNPESKSWSWSPASSGSNDDFSSPVISALKRLSSRSNNTSSKSLENLNSPPGGERSHNNSGSQGSLVKSQQTRSSTSVTLLQHDETDSDSLLEGSLGYRRNTGSSVSNLSLSSGITSTSSVSSLQAGEVQGSVQLAVNFIQRLEEFHVFVVLCRDLAVADAKRNVSDPYVKCYLVPDKTKLGKRKTSVKKKTTNPTFNEILRFKVLMEVLKSQTLNVSVWHNNTFGRNSFLGDVDVDLSTWDFSNTHINEYVLKARSEPATPSCLTDSRGRMRVALRFLPQTSHSRRTSRTETGEVQIWVKDCKDLPPVRGVVIDPFVKCAVLPDTSQKSRQKTRVVKRTANPMFNHTMVYDGFRPEDLREACVEVTVWDHDRLNNHYIGGVRLGLGTGKSYGADVVWMDSTSDEASLWRRMLASDGDWVEDVLPLRMLLMAKSTSK